MKPFIVRPNGPGRANVYADDKLIGALWRSHFAALGGWVASCTGCADPHLAVAARPFQPDAARDLYDHHAKEHQ